MDGEVGPVLRTPDRMTATSIIHGIGPQKVGQELEERVLLLRGDLVRAELLQPLPCLGLGQTLG